MEKGYVSPAFEKIYRNYLKELVPLDLAERAVRLGGRADGNTALIPFYGLEHRVSPDGIVGPDGRRPPHSISVVLCKYLLLCPRREPPGEEWVGYKDFRDAAPYVQGFTNTAERPLAEHFAGRPRALEAASAALGGVRPEGDLPYEVVAWFPALPKVPLLMLFNDADEEFPARTVILFENRAQSYLDVECIAITGNLLPVLLKSADPDGAGQSVLS